MWVPLVARVEWRSEGRDSTFPAAVLVAGERRLVVLDRGWVSASAEAGHGFARIFVVRDQEGRGYRIASGERDRVEIEVVAPL